MQKTFDLPAGTLLCFNSISPDQARLIDYDDCSFGYSYDAPFYIASDEPLLLLGMERAGGLSLIPVVLWQGRIMKTWHTYQEKFFYNYFRVVSRP